MSERADPPVTSPAARTTAPARAPGNTPGASARNAEARDFRSPRRFSAARILELGALIENGLAPLERRLADSLGLRGKLELSRLGESDAETLFAGAAEPLVVLRFKVQGQPGWLVWEPLAAVRTLETILGSKADAGVAARKLSSAESKLATALLTEVARSTASALKLAASDFVLVQAAPELGSWKDGAEGKEAHRVSVELTLASGDHSGKLCVHLPGIGTGESEPAPPSKLPAHLGEIEVQVAARLPGCEIALDQLLALEEGDVIPLEARIGDPTELVVEGQPLALGRLGTHRGRLAVRIEKVATEKSA